MALFHNLIIPLKILSLLLGISFIYFGVTCFSSTFMKKEFERYNLANQRKLVGMLQILGAIGVILGFFFNEILLCFSSAGLGLLMVAGFAVRLKIKDSVLQSSPSFLYAILSFYIGYAVLIDL